MFMRLAWDVPPVYQQSLTCKNGSGLVRFRVRKITRYPASDSSIQGRKLKVEPLEIAGIEKDLHAKHNLQYTR